MDKVILKKEVLLGYPSVYHDAGVVPASLLSDLPQNASIEFISYLLHLYNLRKKNDFRFQSHQFYQWMMQTTNDNKSKTYSFIQREATIVNSPDFKLLDRRPCLDLIQHILVYADMDNHSSLSAEHYTALFKCLLHFNSIENNIQEKLFHWKGTGSAAVFADHILPIHFRNIENERFKDYEIQFLKVFYFFEFCESQEKYSAYLAVFLKSLGLTSYKSYLWKILSPYLRLICAEEPTPIVYLDDEHDTLHFYNRLTINGHIEQVDQDYLPIRQHPLFQSRKNTYVFMDFRFFVDKFYQGFLFDFASEVAMSFGKLKTDMGNLFSETILFYAVMKRCFNSYGTVRLTGEHLKNKLRQGEPDYYMREGSKLFLFEFKDIVINAAVKYSGTPQIIKAGILEKLEKTKSGQKKGIAQLLNTIEEIKAGVYTDSQVDHADWENVTIYPIIVHTDITLESYGVNYFLKNRFKELIQEKTVQIDGLKELTLINLDTLIHLQDHFANGKLILGECIDSYITYVSSDHPPTATFPFDEFVKYYFVKLTGEKIGKPKEFTEIIARFEKEAGT